jgi:hypothetical protein
MSKRRSGLIETGVVAAIVAVLALAIGASSAGARGAQPSRADCTAKFFGGAMHLCGPATALFRGHTFRNGTCKRETVAGEPTLTLELGQIAVPPGKTNGGRPYLKIGISGPLSHPTSGYVISYYDSKRWSGIGGSFKASFDARHKFVGGSFVGSATPPSRGTARGSFRC